MKTRTIIKDQNGATAVEFAIILPLLVLLLFGIIEFGLLLYNQHVITNAAREGARYGIIVRNPRVPNVDESGIEGISTKVKDYARSHLITFGSDKLDDADIILLDINNNSGTFNPATDRCTSFGCELRVEVIYQYDFLVLSSLGFGPITLNPRAIMKME